MKTTRCVIWGSSLQQHHAHSEQHKSVSQSFEHIKMASVSFLQSVNDTVLPEILFIPHPSLRHEL